MHAAFLLGPTRCRPYVRSFQQRPSWLVIITSGSRKAGPTRRPVDSSGANENKILAMPPVIIKAA